MGGAQARRLCPEAVVVPPRMPVYPADPPTVDEIVAVMRHARHATHGDRLNVLIVVLWRAGLRIGAGAGADRDRSKGATARRAKHMSRPRALPA
jgi:hypothetical protein